MDVGESADFAVASDLELRENGGKGEDVRIFLQVWSRITYRFNASNGRHGDIQDPIYFVMQSSRQVPFVHLRFGFSRSSDSDLQLSFPAYVDLYRQDRRRYQVDDRGSV
jgi:hypothetical protein